MKAFFMKPAVIVCSLLLAVLFVMGVVHTSFPSSKVTFTKFGTAVGMNPVHPATSAIPAGETGTENAVSDPTIGAPGRE